MKYFIFNLTHRSDSTGFYKAWHLIKPHERLREYDKLPPGMTLTYDGFETFEDAESWINEYGEKISNTLFFQLSRSKVCWDVRHRFLCSKQDILNKF